MLSAAGFELTHPQYPNAAPLFVFASIYTGPPKDLRRAERFYCDFQGALIRLRPKNIAFEHSLMFWSSMEQWSVTPYPVSTAHAIFQMATLYGLNMESLEDCEPPQENADPVWPETDLGKILLGWRGFIFITGVSRLLWSRVLQSQSFTGSFFNMLALGSYRLIHFILSSSYKKIETSVSRGSSNYNHLSSELYMESFEISQESTLVCQSSSRAVDRARERIKEWVRFISERFIAGTTLSLFRPKTFIQHSLSLQMAAVSIGTNPRDPIYNYETKRDLYKYLYNKESPKKQPIEDDYYPVSNIIVVSSGSFAGLKKQFDETGYRIREIVISTEDEAKRKRLQPIQLKK